MEWGSQMEVLQDRSALHQWQRHQVASVQPKNVEDVIGDVWSAPIYFAVEDKIFDGQFADRLRDVGVVLGKLIPGEELNVPAAAECEKADAVVLAFEEPLWAGKALLRERRGHRDYPFGKGHAAS